MAVKKNQDDLTVEAVREKPDDVDLTQVQHPALLGEEGMEVARRGADIVSDNTMTFTKDFVLLGYPDGFNHEPNMIATRVEVMNAGLRPDGDVKFEGAHDHPDGESTILRYTVPVRVAALPGLPADVQHARASTSNAPVDGDHITSAEDAQADPPIAARKTS
jgi:hypothetical protein